MATDTEKITGNTNNNANANANDRIGENPIKTLGSQSANPDRTDGLPSSNASLTVNSSENLKSTVGSVSATDSALVSDVQKKMRRAERFGMPVQLSEEEKRNSRAERFGTSSTLQGSDTSNRSEELKRKARAERFGLPVPPVATDEEVKKKARLARFSSDPKTDSLEEDKRRARSIRFSQPTTSVSQVNGKGNIELKAAIAGKAGGGS